MTGGASEVPEMDEEQSVERERSARALVAAQDSFDTLFENAPVMMHSIDEEGRLLRVNRRWTESLGYKKDEVLGHRSIDFLADESRLRATEDTLPLFWRAGAARSVGYQFLKKNGGPLDVFLDAEAVRTASDKRFSLAALRDPFDTREKRQASATIRALRELARLQRQYEAALPAEGIMYAALAIPAQEQGDLAPEISARISIDLEYHRVTLNNRTVRLTPREWAVLRVLADKGGRVVSARQLLQEVWGPEYGDEIDYVRAYIGRLRKKLEPDPNHPRYILLERGMGYRLVLSD